MNKSGEVVAAVKTKEPRIKTGVRVYSTKIQLKSLVKQGDLPYDTIQTVGNIFRFYGVVIKADAKKGWWHVDYNMFPLNGKSLRISRNICCTIPEGQDEPVHEFRNERVDAAIANLETLESDPDEDVELAVEESYDDENRGRASNTKKNQKKKTRKVLSLESFIGMSDDGVLQAKTFDHYYGDDNADYIRWDILEDGEEITEDVMKHDIGASSPFKINIPWNQEKSLVEYFDVFFASFFPPLEGKAEVLDRYLANPNYSGHQAYWAHDKVRFHCPDRSDPDFILKIYITLVIAPLLEVEHGIVNLSLQDSSIWQIMASTCHKTTSARSFVDFLICGVPDICGIQKVSHWNASSRY